MCEPRLCQDRTGLQTSQMTFSQLIMKIKNLFVFELADLWDRPFWTCLGSKKKEKHLKIKTNDMEMTHCVNGSSYKAQQLNYSLTGQYLDTIMHCSL